MKNLKNFFFAALALCALSLTWSCGDDESEIERPNTEEDDCVVTFNDVTVTVITYNRVNLSATYTMENVGEKAGNKIVCRISTAEDQLDQDNNVYVDLPLDKSGKIDVDLYLRPNTDYCLRLDAVVGKNVFKSNVVSFSTPEKAYVPVSSITLSESSVTMKVGEVKELEAFVEPKDADHRDVNWSFTAYEPYPIEWTVIVGTDFTDRRTNRIKAICPGQATVYAQVKDGDKTYTAECAVTVVE